MVLDPFGEFAPAPPEIISGRMYSGPGAAPLQAAAAAWDVLAGELQAARDGYASVLAGLVGEWQGPSAVAMNSAASRYSAWLSTAATHAERTAAQARAAGQAYETAFAAVVPPAAIVANRNRLATLVATNILGQNIPAIAEVEAQYHLMWAQDAAAMHGYAAASATATRLPDFTVAPQTTSGAVPPATDAGTEVSPALQSVLNGINSLTSGYNDIWRQAIDGLTGSPAAAGLWESSESLTSSAGSQTSWANAVHATYSFGGRWFRKFYKPPEAPTPPKSALISGLTSPATPTAQTADRPTASAASGGATSVGALSVPANWATATPAIRLAASAPTTTNAAALPAVDAAGALSPAVLGSMTGGALGTPIARAGSASPPSLTTTSEGRPMPARLDDVIAQLRQTPDVVQHWNVDEAGLDDLLAKLSLRPGIHAVHVSADGEPAIGPTAAVTQ